MLGIVIGIASVIILMSIGQSAQDLIISQVQGVGSNLVIILPGGTISGKNSTPSSVAGIVTKTLVQADVDALGREPSVSQIVSAVKGQAPAVYGDNSLNAAYVGVTANFFSVVNFPTKEGRQFNQNDVDALNHVAVIGSGIATTIFGNVDPINQYMPLGNVEFRVVGVLSNQGTGSFGAEEDDVVVIPITVAQEQLLGINYLSEVIVQANSAYNPTFVQSRIESVLEQDHKITDPTKDDFTIETEQDLLSLLGNVTSIMTLFLAAIASISLIVGGIGIMNIMLVSVTERTKEIGLRKAVGATNKDIMQQFMVEAVVITFLGGVIGITVGAIFAGLAYLILSHVLSTGWTFEFPLSAVLLGVAVSTITGLVFGIYPARQAARKSPIESLRYE
jgi:putative ABC transport system permease protein